MITKITENNNEFYESLFKEVSDILKAFISNHVTTVKGKVTEESLSEITFIEVANNGEINVEVETGIVTDVALNTSSEKPYIYYNMGVPEEIDFNENKEIAIQLCQAYLDVGKGDIKGLEEYFGIIETITNCIDTNYQILPLVAQDGQWIKDEEPFIIDANTRKIKIPDNNYTYAVSGDDLAETIYFVIDRYFDNVDLTTKNIAVLSQINNQKILTSITLKDITSLPDKIIFGWPISQVLTKGTSGILDFSVRFYTLNGTEIDYSLNTIPEKLNIKPTLDFLEKDAGVIVDNASERAKELLANADIKGTAAVKAPVFHLGEGEKKILNLGSNGTLDLHAAAHSLDALPISYYWTQKSESETFEEIEDSKNNDSDLIEYIEITPENLAKEIEKYGIFYTGEDKIQVDLSNEIPDPNVIYYRKGSSQTVNIAGYYQCVATAKRGSIRQKATRSAIFEVPSPSEITLQRNNNYLNKDLKFFFDNGENSASDSAKTKLLNIIDTVYKQNDNVYKGKIDSSLTQTISNTYTLTRTNQLNNKSTSASFENIIIYDALPVPDIDFNITNIKTDSRDITISLNNFNSECMDYNIILIRDFDGVEVSMNADKPLTIGQGATYTIHATYLPKYPSLNGIMPSATTNNSETIESTTAVPPATASFII